jgi:dTDP-4-dehydrorhamnose 3,5-epimerase
VRFIPLAIGGVWRVEPERHADERGFFARTWCTREFAAQGLVASFVQTSVSFNEAAGTLRGLHYQVEPHAEEKLVRCTRGAIFDVAVDLRPDSPTYLAWCGETLTAANALALYVPKGCAHGFMTLEDASEVLYAISELYAPDHARGVRWNDPAVGVVWPREPARMSARDAGYALMAHEARR